MVGLESQTFFSKRDILLSFDSGHLDRLVEFFGSGERGHNAVQGGDGRLVVVLLGGVLQLPQLRDERFLDGNLLADVDELVLGLLQALLAHQELLE